MKEYATAFDVKIIKKMLAAGESVENIRDVLQVSEPVVQSFYDKANPKPARKKPGPKPKNPVDAALQG